MSLLSEPSVEVSALLSSGAMMAVKKRYLQKVSPLQERLIHLVLYDSCATASQLSKKLKVPRTSLLYHLDLLEYSGYLRSFKDGRYRFFELGPKGAQFVRSGHDKLYKDSPASSGPVALSDEPLDRCHNVYIKSAIVRMPSEKALLKLGFQKGDRMKNWGQDYYGFRLEHCSVQITPKHFLFFLDELFAENSHVATLLAFSLVADAITLLEESLPGLRLGEPQRLAVMVRQHHALQNDLLAQKVRAQGVTVKTERFEIDSSKGKPELDFTHPQHAPEDFERYVTAKAQAGPEGAVELVEETIQGRFSPKGVNEAIHRITDLQQNVIRILEKISPGGTPPPATEPEGGMYG